MKNKQKSEITRKIFKLKNEYNSTTDIIQKEYIRNKILRLINQIKDNETIQKNEIEIIKNRLNNLNKYGQVYNYTLSENLREQITITVDSIRSSPLHLKQMEIKNTSMLQYKDMAIEK